MTLETEQVEIPAEAFAFVTREQALASLSQDEIVAQYHKTCQLIKAAEEAKAALVERIHDFLGRECGTLAGPGYVLTCKEVTRQVTDYKAVLQEAQVAPELVARYTKPTSYKQLKVEASFK